MTKRAPSWATKTANLHIRNTNSRPSTDGVISIDLVRGLHRGKWFSGGSKRVSPVAYAGPSGVYFVTVDSDGDHSGCTIRKQRPGGDIITVSSYMEYVDRAKAELEAARIAFQGAL